MNHDLYLVLGVGYGSKLLNAMNHGEIQSVSSLLPEVCEGKRIREIIQNGMYSVAFAADTPAWFKTRFVIAAAYCYFM